MRSDPPEADEVEVTLFGPGYGEAIAIHVGAATWVLVDSCINPDSNRPASLHYLEEIGVSPSCVKAVIASHWHDDHVRGISRLAAACSSATFYLSGVFSDKEAMAFLAAHGGDAASAQASGTKELFGVLSNAKTDCLFTYQRNIVFEEMIGGRNVQIVAFSPTQRAQTQTLLHVAQYRAAKGKPINHAPDLKPNLEAVVLHVDLGEDAILLGSDLESQSEFGWPEILRDSVCSNKRKASIYKVAHHGSNTGDVAGIWSELLIPSPVTTMTPFNNGSVHLPGPGDKSRIKGAAGAAYITSDARRRTSISPNIRKRMSDICKNLAPRDSQFGAIRARKRLGDKGWTVELFGQAKKL